MPLAKDISNEQAKASPRLWRRSETQAQVETKGQEMIKLLNPVMAADDSGGVPKPPPVCPKCGRSPCRCPPKDGKENT